MKAKLTFNLLDAANRTCRIKRVSQIHFQIIIM